MSRKAVQISDPRSPRMAFVVNKGDEQWAPRNPEARFIGVKAGPAEGEAEKKGAIAKAFEALGAALGVVKAAPEEEQPARKAYFFQQEALPSEPVSNTWPVGENVPDNIDHDDDGAEDYSAYAMALLYAGQDISNALCFSEPVRSAAIVSIVDSFRDGAQKMFGPTEKAGARHNKSDKAAIDALTEAHKAAMSQHEKMGKHLASMGDNLQSLGAGTSQDDAPADDAQKAAQAEALKALAAFVPGELGDDGYPVNMAEYRELSEKAKKKDESPKPYGDVEYADPENGKYPIDTEEHARAAWSYINKQKNADEYSADELKKVKDRIVAACKKFGIDIESKKADEITPDISALIAAEVAKAAATAKAEAKSELDAAIEDVRKAANEQVNAAKAEADAAKAQIATLENTVKALITDARTPTATGGVSTIGSEGQAVTATGEPAPKDVSTKGMTVVEATKALLAAQR